MAKKLKLKNNILFSIACIVFISCSYKNCEDKNRVNNKIPLSFYHIEDTVYNLNSFNKNVIVKVRQDVHRLE